MKQKSVSIYTNWGKMPNQKARRLNEHQAQEMSSLATETPGGKSLKLLSLRGRKSLDNKSVGNHLAYEIQNIN